MACGNWRGRRSSVPTNSRQYPTRPRCHTPSTQKDFRNAMKSARDRRRRGPARPVAFEKRADALVIIARLVKFFHQFAVAGLQKLAVQLGLEVQSESVLLPELSASSRPSVFKRCHRRVCGSAVSSPTIAVATPERWMNSNCRLKMSRLVAVEAHDESAHDLQPGALQRLHRRHQIAVPVLDFVTFRQRLDRGRFNADKNFFESGLRPSARTFPGHRRDSPTPR